MSAPHFGDRLAAAVARRESQIVCGLDPDPAKLWPGAQDVAAHCRAVIDAAAPALVAVKPQLACFERLGPAGWTALEQAVAHARAHDLLVILDGKRGDVPVTARVYAEALAHGDAATVNPLLGRDSLEAYLDGPAAPFLLVRTSNPGAADILDLELADGGRVWERLARLADDLGRGGPESGIADVGAVTGATEPEHLERMRELMPNTPFLLPGVGAQGGDVAALGPAFAPGRAGGLITASRSIVNAYEQTSEDPATAARAEAERLRAQAWDLA
ncbi:MAG: orotidine-5-phosphate decarboxylase [Solirubrobacteraceae bacterium]|jgi:orotidine-5'-phosphate decarboxylase|nr:orotidine-5-phosphate decarboxylase [Solirubrobacteraceae bacterium]